MENVKSACVSIIEAASSPPGMGDYIEKNLHSELLKMSNVKNHILARCELMVNKHSVRNLLEALANEDVPDVLGISFTEMTLDTMWEYDVPTRRIKASSDGKGGLLYFPTKRLASGFTWDPMGDPVSEKAMIFMYTSKWFFPERIEDVAERPLDILPPRPKGLVSVFDWWVDVQSQGYIPFEIVVCAYTRSRRFMYVLDLVNNVLYRDFRMGAVSRKRVSREPLDFLYLDKVLAENVIHGIQKKALMYSFELDSVSPSEIAFGFHITETMAKNHLDGLARRGLLNVRGEGSSATYSVDLGNLRKTKGEVF